MTDHEAAGGGDIVKITRVSSERMAERVGPDGGYVEYDDYAALLARNGGLTQTLERIHKAADEGSTDPVQFRALIRAECRKALVEIDNKETK